MKPVRKKKSIHPILDELASTYIYIAYRLYIEKEKEQVTVKRRTSCWASTKDYGPATSNAQQVDVPPRPSLNRR